ncbi:hypothetical protein GIB67_040278 [Kingdonia uniflora]|uniref:Aminotransferase-like plant mobile domain-containing protein n=1 Tax=Kingdonia uniflora TaxID=39325 RepID=A0A7J7MVA0_9MAGN|nr:hypothetical protein GIB67_040278 [Kingdonia uniflora]
MSDEVYLGLKAGGNEISLSLKKIVGFFAGKLGRNTAEPAAASSDSAPVMLSSRVVVKAYMLYALGSFLFPTKKGTDVSVKYLPFFHDTNSNKLWSWGAATLAHLYYSLGASSRVNAKGLACYTTLLEIKTTNAQNGEAALKMFREALDSYKLEDIYVIRVAGCLGPLLTEEGGKIVASFTGLLCSLEHKEPYYPDRVQRQFNRRQPVPRAPTFLDQSGLRLGTEPSAYKPNYNWEDLFSEGKLRESMILMRGRKVHDGIPVYTDGYFEWFKTVSFTKLCPYVVNLDENDDGRVLGDSGDVSHRENVKVSHSPNEGGARSVEVVEDQARSDLVEALRVKMNVVFLWRQTKDCRQTFKLSKLPTLSARKTPKESKKKVVLECASLRKSYKKVALECVEVRESNQKVVEDLQLQLAKKLKECENLATIIENLLEEVTSQSPRPLPLNLVPHSEENVVQPESRTTRKSYNLKVVQPKNWKQKYEELNTKFEEAQRRLSERDRNGVWRLTLKAAIEGWDFKDTEDPTWEELSKQFTKLLIIAQEGPKGEYEDDIILSGRGEYQERIDSRLKKIDHRTNRR